jgi:putative transposase
MATINLPCFEKGMMMPITPELLDELLKDYKSPADMFGDDGLLQQLTKAVVERALQGEMTHHLGYERHDPAGQNSGNSRNGKSKKTIKGKRGQIEIDVPRDRASEFEPQLIKKGQTRFDGFDDKIISMYSRGMTCREIKAHLQEIYGVEVSPDLISTVTDSVIDEVRAWQSRPLDAVYPILYLDALQVKVKDQGRVSNKAIYLAIGVNVSGIKEVLGMWVSENEGAKFWLSIITELKNRGVRDKFNRLCGRPQGFSRSHRDHLPEDAGPVVSSPPDALFFSLCLIQRSESSRLRPQGDLSGGECAGSRTTSYCLCREVGHALPFDC